MTTQTKVLGGSETYQAPEIYQITMDSEGIFCFSGEQNDSFSQGEDFFLF